MSYARCSFKSVLDQVLAFSGQSATQLDATQAMQLRNFIAMRLKDWAWIAYPWPDITLTEERFYRANYAAGTAYAAPTLTSASEVYFPPTQQYYQALKATTGNDPATLIGGAYGVNAAYWAVASGPYQGPDWAAIAYAVGTQVRNPADGRYYQCHTAHTGAGSLDTSKFGVLTVFDPYIAPVQAWQTNAVGEFLAMYLDNPMLERTPRRVNYRLDGLGAHVLTAPFTRWGRGLGADYLVPNRVFLKFRLPCPSFRGPVFDAAGTYAANADVVYFAGTTVDLEGDYWACTTNTTAGQSPATTPASWTRQPFPSHLSTAVARRAFADWLRYGANREGAQAEDGAADDALYQEQLRAGAQQGQVLKWRKNG